MCFTFMYIYSSWTMSSGSGTAQRVLEAIVMCCVLDIRQAIRDCLDPNAPHRQ
jgi:hypothetical protein